MIGNDDVLHAIATREGVVAYGLEVIRSEFHFVQRGTSYEGIFANGRDGIVFSAVAHKCRNGHGATIGIIGLTEVSDRRRHVCSRSNIVIDTTTYKIVCMGN